MNRVVLVLLSLLALALPRGAQNTALPRPPLRVQAVDDPAAFSARATLVDFETFPSGTPLGLQYTPLGVVFERASDLYPSIWSDSAPRPFGPAGAGALSNLLDSDPGPSARPYDPAPGSHPALSARFFPAVNRAGFELRSAGGPHLNGLLTCLHRGRVQETRFFDIDSDFGFVGLESSRPFDQVVLEFTNPARGTFSLDNLRFELDRRDADHDGVPDFLDGCPGLSDPEQFDSDGDGRGDACDAFPLDPRDDEDGDGVGAEADNCPHAFNPDQRDRDHDGVGDTCDTSNLGSDSDGDGVPDPSDNCPNTANPDQEDCDGDGVGDVCDTTLIEPQELDLALGRGQSYTVTKRICLPASPPRVDIVLAVDLTGSMGGEITLVREHLRHFVGDLRELAPDSDILVALVTYRDYPNSYSSCSYSNSYGGAGDYAYRVVAPIGSTDLFVLESLSTMFATGGADGPESYTRVLWEMSHDPGIGFRPGARRVVLNVCDDVPHDCDPDQDLVSCFMSSTGKDPGRDEVVNNADDIDFQEGSLADLDGRNTRLFTVYSNSFGVCAWQQWCERLGGVMIPINSNGTLPPGTDVVGTVLELIADPFVNLVELDPGPCAGLFTFDPPVVVGPIDVTHGAQVFVQETITIPPDFPADTADCAVRILADGVLIGTQRVHVDVRCSALALEGLANGHRVTAGDFAGQGVTLSATGANAGAAVFDSTPGGPNDPGLDSDLLIGRGNLLLLQDDAHGSLSGPGTFATPVDDPDGGELVFDYAPPVSPRSVLLTDLDPLPNEGATVTLVDGAGRRRVYVVPPGWTGTYGVAGFRTLALDTLAPQAGAGTRSATASEDPGFLQDGVVRVVVLMTGLGAMGELSTCR